MIARLYVGSREVGGMVEKRKRKQCNEMYNFGLYTLSTATEPLDIGRGKKNARENEETKGCIWEQARVYVCMQLNCMIH